jgi:hypothetical protein
MKRLLVFAAILSSMLWLGEVSSQGVLTTFLPQGCPAMVGGEPRQGGCSWHGGVCGCGGMRLQCCDGTLSPSCACYQEAMQLRQ